MGTADRRTVKSVVAGRKAGDVMLWFGRIGGVDTAMFEEEAERVRGCDGVLAPERGSEGEADIGVKTEGELTISFVLWPFGIGMK